MLSPGSGQTLTVKFTPADSTDFETVTASVPITVTPTPTPTPTPAPLQTPTPTPATPLVTIAGVSIQKTTKGKGKTKTEVIDVQFSSQVNAAAADNLGVYTLTTMPQGKKRKTKQVALIRAIYNSATKTVMLIPKKSPLSLNPPLILTINGTNLVDTLGRQVDGNGDGQPGGNFTEELG